MTYFLGLTGSIATGKSTVSTYFKEKGIPIIDADIIARDVVAKGTPGLKAIVNKFGHDILLPDGALNRQALGAIIFRNDNKRKVLNNLLSSFIRTEITTQMNAYRKTNCALVIVDIPLLFEGGYQADMDAVMVVSISEATQRQRLMERNDLNEIEAKQRINSQWSIEKKEELADYIIDNNGTKAETYKQIDKWLRQAISI
ncbi:dephospho-CoA kinase [Vagococcus vulneris]|uniref:Dephospho-CoA kinase n=1 Tax=Vagococcus vulneris TaxID=1977869 RepID=A0A430A293_9ENTE|nr:dephospho-CoA kinase [Vagococcus vulneris]RSU00532.1 dephospho-CoA kinase [Vagococcus vulneris]